MQNPDSSFNQAEILLKFLRNELSVQEKNQLEDWLSADEKNRALFSDLTDESHIRKELAFFDEIPKETAWERIAEAVTERPKIVQLNKRKWWYAAAAILIISGGLVVYKFAGPSGEKPTIATIPAQNSRDIPPGGNKALLTLADGSSIILDSAANGTLASQGQALVSKSDGKIAYNASGTETAPMFNTISTPRGGQYQLELADGSKVWLNAASSLRFPVNFTGRERTVELTGEGYFEVAHRASMPFRVKVADKSTVEVLGTHFNINAYENEGLVRTTLLEGSIRVQAATGLKVLVPGQQATLDPNGHISVQSNVNTDEVLAWKNGLFRLNSADIPTIMRQLARWYDLDIVYEGKIPEGHISGTVPMNMNLSKVVEVLKMSGIRIRLEGRKMTILE